MLDSTFLDHIEFVLLRSRSISIRIISEYNRNMLVDFLKNRENEIKLRVMRIWMKMDFVDVVYKNIVADSNLIKHLVELFHGHRTVAKSAIQLLNKLVGDTEYTGFKNAAAMNGIVEGVLQLIDRYSGDIDFIQETSELLMSVSSYHYFDHNIYIKRFELLCIINRLLMYTDDKILMHALTALIIGEFCIYDKISSGCYSMLNTALQSSNFFVFSSAVANIKHFIRHIRHSNDRFMRGLLSESENYVVDAETISTLVDILRNKELKDGKGSIRNILQMITEEAALVNPRQVEIILEIPNIVESISDMILKHPTEANHTHFFQFVFNIIECECLENKCSQFLESPQFVHAFFWFMFTWHHDHGDKLGYWLGLVHKMIDLIKKTYKDYKLYYLTLVFFKQLDLSGGSDKIKQTLEIHTYAQSILTIREDLLSFING